MDHLLCRCIGCDGVTFLLGSSWSSPSSRLGLGPRPAAAAAHVGTHPGLDSAPALISQRLGFLPWVQGQILQHLRHHYRCLMIQYRRLLPPLPNVSTSKLRLRMFSSIFFNFSHDPIMQSARRGGMRGISIRRTELSDPTSLTQICRRIFIFYFFIKPKYIFNFMLKYCTFHGL